MANEMATGETNDGTPAVSSQSHVFNDLPQYNAQGAKYVYRVVEDYIGGDSFWVEEKYNNDNVFIGYGTHNYSVTDGRNPQAVSDKETRITNELIPPEKYIHIKAVKHWDDNNNQDSVRPNEVWFRLTRASSEKTVYSFERATSENNWVVNWKNCPGYDPHGHVYHYTVDEVVHIGQGTETEDFAVVHYDEIVGGTSGDNDEHDVTGTIQIGIDGYKYTTTCNAIVEYVEEPDENGIKIKVREEPFTNSYTPKKQSLNASKDWPRQRK